jgi:tellurite resistance protein
MSDTNAPAAEQDTATFPDSAAPNAAPPKAAPKAAVPAFWRSTPPAVFTAVFGFMGLGLAWRAAAGASALAVPPAISQSILLAATLILLFCLSCYISKLSLRPAVMLEDMATLPGRSGIASMALSIILLSAALTPFASLTATTILILGAGLHACCAVAAVIAMSRSAGGLVVTPIWHLTFVAFILVPLAAIPLGFIGLSQTILPVTLVIAALIYAISLYQLYKAPLPAPQRPLLAIHLAPVSLFAIVSHLLGQTLTSFVFTGLAASLFLILIARSRFLLETGFSPFWAAFTFPVAALSTALFLVGANLWPIAWLGLIPLTLASALTPYVLIRVAIMWARGSLVQKSGAATA